MSSYPVNTFQNSLEVAKAVADSGGANTDVQKSVIAHALGSSDSSGAFIARIAAAKLYGMIEASRNGYRLTDYAKHYFFPSSESEKRTALLMMLKAAPIFAEIIKRFDGNKLPTPDLLSNVLLREFRVPDSWKDRVARFFMKAVSDAGVVDSQGFLRYSAARQSVDTMPAPPSSHVATPTDLAEPAPAPTTAPPRVGMNAWVFSLGGKTVRVETSDDLSPELWKKLDAYIQVLKPSD